LWVIIVAEVKQVDWHRMPEWLTRANPEALDAALLRVQSELVDVAQLAGPSLSGTGAVQDKHEKQHAWMKEQHDKLCGQGEWDQWCKEVQLRTAVGNKRPVHLAEISNQLQRTANRIVFETNVPVCETGGRLRAAFEEAEAGQPRSQPAVCMLVGN
jgi:hypothetical protein